MSDQTPAHKPPLRYCEMCDAWVKGRECPQCGADTRPPLKGGR